MSTSAPVSGSTQNSTSNGKASAAKNQLLIPFAKLDRDAYKNGRVIPHTKDEIESLAKALRERKLQGNDPLIHPVTVGPEDPLTGKYPLKAGWGRAAAIELNKDEFIQVRVDASPFEDVNAQENFGRLDLHPCERAAIIAGFADAGVKPADIGSRIGGMPPMSLQNVNNYLRVFRSPLYPRWVDTVQDPKTRPHALSFRDILGLVGKAEEKKKELVAKIKALADAPDAAEKGAEGFKEYEKDQVRELMFKHANRVLEITGKKREEAEARAKAEAEGKKPGRGSSGSGKSRPGKFQLNSARMDVANLKEWAKKTGQPDEAMKRIDETLDALRWAAGDIDTPPTKLRLKDLQKAFDADRKAEEDKKTEEAKEAAAKEKAAKEKAAAEKAAKKGTGKVKGKAKGPKAAKK